MDSPGLSLQDVARTSAMAPTSTIAQSSSKVTESSSIASSSTGLPSESLTASSLSPHQSASSRADGRDALTYDDSDFEAERDPPDWRPRMDQDDLAKLKPKEKKRQDVINGNALDTLIIQCKKI